MDERDIRGILSSGEWEHFVSRPASLFVASLWHESYRDYIPYITQGKSGIQDGIFIHDKNGVVSNYAKTSQLKDLKRILFEIYSKDKPDILKLIQTAKTLNEKAEKLLESISKDIDFDGALDLLYRVTVFGAILPRFLADALYENGVHDKVVLKDCDDLRKVSFYPKLLKEVFLPKAIETVSNLGIEGGEKSLSFILINELRNKDFSQIQKRIDNSDNGQQFIYIANKDEEVVLWSEDTRKLIDSIQGEEVDSGITEIIGQSACKGSVRGRARICVTLDGSDIKNFDDGDILVSINSSPNLIKWINKAGAIVTDEGGITCHAAIISRELKLPCIIATKNATKVIVDGELIEVDANLGTVKLIKS